MAKETKKKNPSFTTPRGTFKYPKLNEPDTKFKEAGEYGVKLILSAEAGQALIDKLTPLYDEAVEAGEAEYAELPVATRKKTPFKTNDFYTPVYNEDTEEETGEIEFTFKMAASGVNKKTGKTWERKPAIFDAKGKPMVNPPAIWGGTEGKVNFEVMPYFTATAGAGISLRLNAVQILELVSGGMSRSASAYGFGEEEGFDASEMDAEEETTTAGDSTEADEEDTDF